MSRIGKLPVIIPEGVEINITGLTIEVKGKKGTISKSFSGPIELVKENNSVLVKPLDMKNRSMWGTARSIISSMVKGVTEGFREELEVNGVGYRAIVKNGFLNLTLGKSHNTKIEIPNSVKVDAPKQNIIVLESHDKEKLGQYVAVIRSQRPPEPYKGKGIKCKGEYVQRKEGKKS
ncbi:MAG: hypothetical protein DGJ47_000516 [Rickettsiaceae bacterium]